jgi:hypothetical protein
VSRLTSDDHSTRLRRGPAAWEPLVQSTVILGGEIPAECEAILRRFEETWRGRATPDLDVFLSTVGPIPDRFLFELVHIELDFRLRRGEAVRVEDYLRRHPDLERDPATLMELIVAEYALRRCWGAGSTCGRSDGRWPWRRGWTRSDSTGSR